MARRVKQADGSYCYTENCRIHDRSLSDSTGVQAVVADALEAQRQASFSQAAAVLTDIIKVDEATAKELAEKALTAAAHHELGVTPYTIATELHKAGDEKGLDTENWNSFDASYAIHSTLSDDAVIKAGDEVILNASGERGTISEGHTGFGGVVRFNPENIRSRNSFAWFGAEAITKLPNNQDGLARQRIVSASRDSLIPASLVNQMIQEETSSRTRNAQATKEFGKESKAARENLRKFGAELENRYKNKTGLTKSHVLKLLTKEYFENPMTGASEAEVRATKGGLRNIMTYLDPQDPTGRATGRK